MGSRAVTPRTLSATTCVLPNRGSDGSPLQLWMEMAGTLCARAGSPYRQNRAQYRLLLTDTRVASPDGEIFRYRTVNLRPRIKAGLPTLLDIDAGNWFCRRDDESIPLRAAEIPATTWVRSVSTVPLDEHLRLARAAAKELKDSGWVVERAELEPLPLAMPRVETPHGVQAYAPGSVPQLAKWSLNGCAPLTIRVMQLDGRCDFESVSDSLRDVWATLTRNAESLDVVHVDAPDADPSSVTLVLLADNVELTQRADLRTRLAVWEKAGYRFKLARAVTLGNRYAAQNICLDLALMAGLGFGGFASGIKPAVALDAGHDSDGNRSRWASARVDDRLRVDSLSTIDTELAEHIPRGVTERFWPKGSDAMVLRDGRLARERASWNERASAEERWVMEVKKHPGTILFRTSNRQEIGARFGDAVVDAHGDVLLQTLSQGTGDCHHPLRVSLAATSDRDAQLQALFTQTAVPGLTLFRPSRLPGAIYWADLASKLDRTGWTQVIGRGWRLTSVVPG